MAYAIDLDDDMAESDIPTTVIRSKADLQGIEVGRETFGCICVMIVPKFVFSQPHFFVVFSFRHNWTHKLMFVHHCQGIEGMIKL